ncbi:DinB family protein [Mucilaginibacter rigui]|uniref:DinB family protein n=1 Tax=Mucilaginibacter rigui TaxID=534635 RepID=A0ABR7WZL4_9SPHI|nr:DinB family protein [Mucilaginibacter rigui]MBD1383789.1 DinB family protein [Mucilaginibacter rigui]
MITNTLTTLRVTRLHLLHLIENLTTEQLNKVPAGFNNNIIWNVAHAISAQQGVCYTRANVPFIVDDKYYTPYRPDTKPSGFIDSAEVDIIKGLLISTIDKLEIDYNNHVFDNYTPWATRYGVQINNIEEAVNFVPFHDGMHIGYVMALRKLV